jgi:hypothetical protein
MKLKRANRPTVQAVVGCPHEHVNGICLGVAICRDCGRVFIELSDGTIKTCRAGGYTPNDAVSGGAERRTLDGLVGNSGGDK